MRDSPQGKEAKYQSLDLQEVLPGYQSGYGAVGIHNIPCVPYVFSAER
jgi:hypothetical protein